MDHQIAIITGAAGFLGSAITVDLSRDHRVVALDRRKPSSALLESAPGVVWHQVDIADTGALAAAFRVAAESLGRIDFVVHFAAFYHFGIDCRPEYERYRHDRMTWEHRNRIREAGQYGYDSSDLAGEANLLPTTTD